MPDTSDHLFRLDERAMQIPDRSPAEWDAAESYVQRHGADVAAYFGFGSSHDVRTRGAR